MKTKKGQIIMEVTEGVETLIDEGGVTHFVYLPDLDTVIKAMPSPVLEDFYHQINGELLFRDQEYVARELKKLEEA